MLDEMIAMAISENESKWVVTLSHHAAIISKFLGDLARVKEYYQKSLAFNPENPRALSGLADIAEQEGELELARQYAARSYRALMQGDALLKDAQIEMLLKKWPDLAER